MESMYRENLMDHYKNPRNYGRLDNADIEQKGFNPLCGDEIEIFVNFEEEIVKEVKSEAKGCAISQAAASMLTESIEGKTVEELKKITKEDIFEMLGIELSVSRIKCALLAWDSLREGIIKFENG